MCSLRAIRSAFHETFAERSSHQIHQVWHNLSKFSLYCLFSRPGQSRVKPPSSLCLWPSVSPNLFMLSNAFRASASTPRTGTHRMRLWWQSRMKCPYWDTCYILSIWQHTCPCSRKEHRTRPTPSGMLILVYEVHIWMTSVHTDWWELVSWSSTHFSSIVLYKLVFYGLYQAHNLMPRWLLVNRTMYRTGVL